jgi:hypothetical protein
MVLRQNQAASAAVDAHNRGAVHYIVRELFKDIKMLVVITPYRFSWLRII